MKRKKTFRDWIASGKVNKRLVIVTFMLVPMLLLIVFTYFPFAKMVQFSFYDMAYLGDREFVGLENYIEVFTRDDCFQALKLSGYYMVGAFVQLALALFLLLCSALYLFGARLFARLQPCFSDLL